mmetsp:Transcript_46744/g.77392  ORF Transcript_46744/g.77392 Transcript_46744/m.77392 type:complete len:204 (-) Transcript_46744:134-745(-)
MLAGTVVAETGNPDDAGAGSDGYNVAMIGFHHLRQHCLDRPEVGLGVHLHRQRHQIRGSVDDILTRDDARIVDQNGDGGHLRLDLRHDSGGRVLSRQVCSKNSNLLALAGGCPQFVGGGLESLFVEVNQNHLMSAKIDKPLRHEPPNPAGTASDNHALVTDILHEERWEDGSKEESRDRLGRMPRQLRQYDDEAQHSQRICQN